MGIQTFFSTIRHNKYFGKCVSERRGRIHKGKKITGLFLDFNAIIHTISFILIEELNKEYLETLISVSRPNFDQIKRNILINRLSKFTNNYNKDDLLSLLVIYVIGESINELIKDTFIDSDIIKMIYISIDGTPSKGKLIEQISRSYSSSFVHSMNDLILNKYKYEMNTMYKDYNPYLFEKTKFEWTKYHIQPGTKFMGNLSKFLKDKTFLQNIVLKDFNKDLYSKVILSDFREVGEGEIKLLNYIKHAIAKKILDQNDTISIYSPDADLILLSSLIPFDYINNIILYRHSDSNKKFKYWSIDIKKFKALLFNKLQNMSDNPIEMELECLQRYVNDIVFVFSLFGDDFVPRISSYHASMHFDHILNCYVHILEDNTYLTDTINLTINNKMFRELIRYLSIYENNAMVETSLNENFENFRKWDKKGFHDILGKYDEYWMVILNKSIVCYNLIKNIFQRRNIEVEEVNQQLKVLENSHSKYIDILYKDLIFQRPNRRLITSENESIILEEEIKKDDSDLIYSLKFFKEYFVWYRQMPRLRTLVLKKNDILEPEYNNTNVLHKYELVKKSFIKMKSCSYLNWSKKLKKNENITDKLGFIDGLKSVSRYTLPYYYFSSKLHFGKEFERSKNIYYKHKLNVNNRYQLDQCIEKYLNGLMWVFYSYNSIKNPLMNFWTYGKHNAPLIQNIKRFLDQEPDYDLNSFKNEYNNTSTNNTKEFFTPFHKILYTTPYEGIMKVLPEYKDILGSLYNQKIDLREYFEKLGLDENIIAKALIIFNKFNYPNMKYEAQKVFYNDYNNSINCADAMYISKCKLNILRKLHINHNFDTDFILVINEINKKLLFNDKSLNNSIIPKFYLE